MKASATLSRSSAIYAPRPFSIDYNNASIIDYRSSKKISDQHRQWIMMMGEKSSTSSTKEQNVQVVGTDGVCVDIVVAYLSGNSPDLILSLLGCIDITPNNNARMKFLPVMLNARWTAREIVSALRVSSPNGINNGKVHQKHKRRSITLIIYGPGFESVAGEAVDMLRAAVKNATNNLEKDHEHFVCAEVLPQFTTTLAYENDSNPELSSACGNQTKGPKNNTADSNVNPKCNNDSNTSSINNDAIILFTSGTSSSQGIPKGVRLSHLSLLTQGMAKLGHPCSYDSDTVMLATVPFFHVGGLSSALAVIMAGGCLLFPAASGSAAAASKPNIGFRADAALSTLYLNCDGSAVEFSNGNSKKNDGLSKVVANTLILVPAMLHLLLEEMDKHKSLGRGGSMPSSFSNVKLILMGGQSVTASQLVRAKTAFPNAKFVQTYACTEAGSSITFAELTNKTDDLNNLSTTTKIRTGLEELSKISGATQSKDGRSIIGTYVGVPPPHTEIGIFTPTTNTRGSSHEVVDSIPHPPEQEHDALTLRPFKVGYIATRGPHIMNGYWRRYMGNDEIESRRALPSGDWLKTNDLGYLDDRNRLYFCGRGSDVVRTGGETVFAPEVERVVNCNEFVESCAVFALPDDKLGETVSIAIVVTSNHRIFNKSSGVANHHDIISILTDEIRRHCAKHQLSGYKRPRRLFVLDKLPRNSSGKVLKYKLVEMFKGREFVNKFVSAERSKL